MDSLIVDDKIRIDNMKRNSEISMSTNQLVFRSPKNGTKIHRASFAQGQAGRSSLAKATFMDEKFSDFDHGKAH